VKLSTAIFDSAAGIDSGRTSMKAGHISNEMLLMPSRCSSLRLACKAARLAFFWSSRR